MSEERFVAIETKLDQLSGQVAALDDRMHVLHEDTIANIKALAPDFAPVRREFREADTKLKEEILQQLARRPRRQ